MPVDLVTVGNLFVEITPTCPGISLADAKAYTLVAGGGAANVVFALAKLGVSVHFITAVGDDPFGTFVTQELATFGIATSGVRRVTAQQTPVSFCAIDGHGGKEFLFYRFPGLCTPIDALEVADFVPATQGRLFDFCEGSIREPALRALVFAAARDARAAGVPVLYAANLRLSAWRGSHADARRIEQEAVALADVVVLNAEEVAFITGQDGETGLRALQALGPRVVVMTAGGDLPIAVRVDDVQAAVAPFRVPVIYDVGAGDTFHAGLVAAVLQDDIRTLTPAGWVAAARFGAATAAIRVSTSADPHDLPSAAIVQAWMQTQGTGERLQTR